MLGALRGRGRRDDRELAAIPLPQAVSAAKKTAEEEFKKRNYAAAADAYATAAACAGGGADKADLLVKKAMCFVMLQRWVWPAGGATDHARAGGRGRLRRGEDPVGSPPPQCRPQCVTVQRPGHTEHTSQLMLAVGASSMQSVQRQGHARLPPLGLGWRMHTGGALQQCTTTRAHRFKEAAKECSSALDASPNHPTALKTRSKAYEQQALFKQALADMQVRCWTCLCVRG